MFVFPLSRFFLSPEPAKSFDIAAVEVNENDYDDDSFNITCTAIGVYPEPEIKLFKVQSINDSLEAQEIQSNSTTILSFRSVADEFYSITLVSHIEHNTTKDQNGDPLPPARARLVGSKGKQTKPDPAEHYECRLSIPNSNYVEVKRLAIQDGKSNHSHTSSHTINGWQEGYFNQKQNIQTYNWQTDKKNTLLANVNYLTGKRKNKNKKAKPKMCQLKQKTILSSITLLMPFFTKNKIKRKV